METHDWQTHSFKCDGQNDADRLNTLKQQIHYLNRVYFGRAMTRAQKTAKLHELKVAMNRGKSANTSYDDDDASFSSNDTNPLNDERFIVEGDPDSLVREYLFKRTDHARHSRFHG